MTSRVISTALGELPYCPVEMTSIELIKPWNTKALATLTPACFRAISKFSRHNQIPMDWLCHSYKNRKEIGQLKTIFCLFRDYQDASRAVQHLAQQRFNQNRLNSLILEHAAKNSIDINPAQLYGKSNIPVTGDGRHTLDLLLSRKQPVTLNGVGKVYASGELANMLTKTAASLPNNASEGGLEGALVDFGLPSTIARKYVEGLRGGGLLLFLRTEDEQAPEVAQMLKSLEGTGQIAQAGR